MSCNADHGGRACKEPADICGEDEQGYILAVCHTHWAKMCRVTYRPTIANCSLRSCTRKAQIQYLDKRGFWISKCPTHQADMLGLQLTRSDTKIVGKISRKCKYCLHVMKLPYDSSVIICGKCSQTDYNKSCTICGKFGVNRCHDRCRTCYTTGRSLRQYQSRKRSVDDVITDKVEKKSKVDESLITEIYGNEMSLKQLFAMAAATAKDVRIPVDPVHEMIERLNPNNMLK